MKKSKQNLIISEIKKCIEESKTPGKARTYFVDDYEVYAWKGDIYIVEDGMDRPAEAYSEEVLDSILATLETGSYEEEFWDPAIKKWCRKKIL